MPRKKRITQSHYVYHVLNRGAKKAALFESADDYRAFERLMGEAGERLPMRIFGYCLMPNHWHLLLWPRSDNDLSQYVQWLTTTHAIRWNKARGRSGEGAVYQSRFKSIPIERGPHLYWAWRYVERNALRANLVGRAEDWQWCSLWARAHAPDCFLDEGPVALPDDWLAIVNIPQTESELTAFRRHVARSQPFGSKDWLKPPMKPRGRPATFTKNVKMGSDPF